MDAYDLITSGLQLRKLLAKRVEPIMEEYGLKPVIRYVFINQCIQKVLVPYKKSNFVF